MSTNVDEATEIVFILTVPRENSIAGKLSDIPKGSKPADLAKHVKSKLNKLRRRSLASKGTQVSQRSLVSKGTQVSQRSLA
jgi:hypothetical protein